MESRPYGSWESPLTSAVASSKVLDFEDLIACPDRPGTAFWTESRPDEGGRSALCCSPPNKETLFHITPSSFNCRSRVHEYGGSAIFQAFDRVFFVNAADQCIYWIPLSDISNRDAPSPPTRLSIPSTPSSSTRFSDFCADTHRNRLICVREQHSEQRKEPINSIIAIHIFTGEEQTLVMGHDFYSSPCISPDGSKLAWVSWNHPNMPWDSTMLCLAVISPADGSLDVSTFSVAAGPMQQSSSSLFFHPISHSEEESVLQPTWIADNTLVFVSDRHGSGCWKLYCARVDGNGWTSAAVPMVSNSPIDDKKEFASPQWVFGQRHYVVDRLRQITFCIFTENGTNGFAIIDTSKALAGTPKGELHICVTPFTVISRLVDVGDDLLFVAGSPSLPTSIIRASKSSIIQSAIEKTALEFVVVQQSIDSLTLASIPEDMISVPEAIEYPTIGGEEQQTSHAFVYYPKNSKFGAPEGELPPVVVVAHGGPTGTAKSNLQLPIQYLTSRGFAVLDVNYRGSSGYGRSYRNSLRGQWGVYDVDDCCQAVLFLKDKVDINRCCIAGGSAGGFTVLSALAFRDTFKAGASHYGIGDLAGLATETHKFEARYLDRLVGPLPQALDIYKSRSALEHCDRISCPLILFQGSDDHVVLPSQSRTMFEAVKARGLPTAYLEFEGEGHGFKNGLNLQKSMAFELLFFARCFGIKLAPELDSPRGLVIVNEEKFP